MINVTDKSQCTGCTACFNACNHKAISMQHDEYGQLYPVVSLKLCTDCGLCERVCPLLNQEGTSVDENLDTLVVKAVYNRDEEVRRRSTSGGTFSLLAQYIIGTGGIVCAARFDEHYHIYHSFFDNMDDIDPYRGSKYAQSDLQNVFRQIKNLLKSRLVLFVGTPCQVAGLKSYLIKDYANLYTCDFICMSISSGKMWDEYITNYQERNSVKRVFFKDKRIGWHRSDWRMLIEDEDGEHLCKGRENPYFYSYLSHYSARPSCFHCVFRHCRRVSDFTIADCWGIESVNPEFDDNKGCTSLILQSEKGQRVFDEIKEYTHFIDYNIENVRQYNKHIEHQAAKPEGYEHFCEDYHLHGFMYATNKVMHKYNNQNFFNRIKRIIIKLLPK